MKNNKKTQTLFFKKIINPKNFTYGVILEILIKYLKKKKTLDAGCGEGNISLFVANHNNDVTGIDESKRSIAICKEKAKQLKLDLNTQFINAKIEKCKFSQKFNLIICTEVIEHVNNDYLILNKFFNWLSNSGILFISTPSKNAPLFKAGIIKKGDKKVGHLRRYTIKYLTRILEDIGFKIVETQKTEGILRNALFFTILGRFPLRLANKFQLIGDIITFLDNISLKLFGSSQIIIVAQKK